MTVGVGLLGSPAGASPTAPIPPGSRAPAGAVPRTSTDAKAAWQNSSHLAEIASEQVNGAEQVQVRSVTATHRANAYLVAAENAVASSKQSYLAASAEVASYQVKLDAYANASFRGARVSELSVMLTATSADDFLDESTVINKVAEDTQETLGQAVAAKVIAAKAQTHAESAEATAAQAKVLADRAAVAAVAAKATAQHRKAALDAAVGRYKGLYEKLSAREKAAAAAAAEKARAESLAAAAALAARQEAAAVEQAADTSSFDASPSDTSSSDTSSSDTSPSDTSSSDTSSSPSVSDDSSVSVDGGDSAGRTAAAAALTKVGFAYVYAGDGPDAYDCSGLTTWAWGQAGIGIPRVSYEQANFPEVPLDQLEPGDLVTYYSPVSHVAIYVGNGMVVSAADEELGIVLRPVDGAGPDPTGHRVPRG